MGNAAASLGGHGATTEGLNLRRGASQGDAARRRERNIPVGGGGRVGMLGGMSSPRGQPIGVLMWKAGSGTRFAVGLERLEWVI
jgi:hypothetical protein